MSLFRHWKIALALLLVFAAGAVAGSVATHHVIKHALEEALKFDNWTAGAMRMMQDKFDLTPEQHRKIQTIVEQTGQEFKGVFAKTLDESGQIIVRSQHQIDQTLTPTQRAIHARMKDEFRADLKKKFDYELPKE
jgi:hypothetical protein